jgi:hypothetical protein
MSQLSDTTAVDILITNKILRHSLLVTVVLTRATYVRKEAAACVLSHERSLDASTGICIVSLGRCTCAHPCIERS